MKKIFFLFLVPFSVFAQRGPNSEYWNTFRYKPKPGMVSKFEAAAAEKTKKFNSQPGRLIATFKVVTGENTGVYERIMPWQSAKDYDYDASQEQKYWNDNVGKYCESVGGPQRWERLKGFDVNIDPNNQSPSKYLKKTTMRIKPSKLNDFYRWSYRIGQVATERITDQQRLLFRLESGGSRDIFVQYIGFDKYEREVTEFDDTWEVAYDTKFGMGTWDRDLEDYHNSFEMLFGRTVETLEFVPEMFPSND